MGRTKRQEVGSSEAAGKLEQPLTGYTYYHWTTQGGQAAKPG